jgi:hypothetical protein
MEGGGASFVDLPVAITKLRYHKKVAQGSQPAVSPISKAAAAEKSPGRAWK